jgi:microcystin degradation protein MlrC
VKVGVDQDGQLFGNIRTKGSTKPIMLMHNTDDPTAGVPAAQKEVMAKLVAETRALDSVVRARSTGPFAEVWVEKTGHGHFSDLTFVYRPDTDEAAVRRARARHHQRLHAGFFEKYLKGKKEVTLPVYPEARLQQK